MLRKNIPLDFVASMWNVSRNQEDSGTPIENCVISPHVTLNQNESLDQDDIFLMLSMGVFGF